MAVVSVDVGGVADSLMKGLDALFTSDEERATAKLAMQVELQKPHMMQAMANVHAAQHPNWFVAGGRPFLMWLSGFLLLYAWFLRDFVIIGIQLFVDGTITVTTAGITNTLPKAQFIVENLPTIDTGEMLTLVFALLGLGGLRTYEKLNGKARS